MIADHKNAASIPLMQAADWLLLVCALPLVLFITSNLWQNDSRAEYLTLASIYAPSQKILLSESKTLTIHGRLGPSLIEISKGAVRFLESPCRNKLCIQNGWLRKAGDSNWCIPNGIGMSLKTKEASKIDGITY